MITFFSILQSNRAVTSSSKERWKKLPGSQPAVAARHHAAGWMLPPPDLIQGKDRRWSGCAVREEGAAARTGEAGIEERAAVRVGRLGGGRYAAAAEWVLGDGGSGGCGRHTPVLDSSATSFMYNSSSRRPWRRMRRILDFSGSWTAFPPLDRQAAAAMEQDGRPEVEASMQRRGKGDEACSVARGREKSEAASGAMRFTSPAGGGRRNRSRQDRRRQPVRS
jgi:hypothetical protein